MLKSLQEIQDNIKTLFKLYRKLKCKNCIEELPPTYILKTGLTDSSDGSNGSDDITSNVKYISADENYLMFINSPLNISNIEGNSVLTLTPNIIDKLNKLDILIRQNNL